MGPLSLQQFSLLHPTPLLPETPVTRARKIMIEERLRVSPVIRSERDPRLLGVLYRRALLLLSSGRSDARVADLYEEPALTLHLDQDARSAAKAMLRADTWYAPVTNSEGKLLGVFGLENILEHLLQTSNPVLERPVEEVMSTRGLAAIAPDEPVYRAWQLMTSRGLAALPVVEKGRIVGVIAEYDLLAHGYTRPVLEAQAGPRRGPRVREAMSTPPVTVTPEEPLGTAAEYMVKRDIGRVYVVDESGRLVGVVDRSDIVSAWLGLL